MRTMEEVRNEVRDIRDLLERLETGTIKTLTDYEDNLVKRLIKDNPLETMYTNCIEDDIDCDRVNGEVNAFIKRTLFEYLEHMVEGKKEKLVKLFENYIDIKKDFVKDTETGSDVFITKKAYLIDKNDKTVIIDDMIKELSTLEFEKDKIVSYTRELKRSTSLMKIKLNNPDFVMKLAEDINIKEPLKDDTESPLSLKQKVMKVFKLKKEHEFIDDSEVQSVIEETFDVLYRVVDVRFKGGDHRFSNREIGWFSYHLEDLCNYINDYITNVLQINTLMKELKEI